jgi:PAS domain S-box-containing protein
MGVFVFRGARLTAGSRRARVLRGACGREWSSAAFLVGDWRSSMERATEKSTPRADAEPPREARSAVALSATEYRLVAEHSPVMVWRSGVDARCDYFNGTWLEFTGRTLEQELGDGWTEGVHPDDLPGCVERYRASFDRREPFEIEYRLRRHDGRFRYILDRGLPRYDAAGRFLGFIGSCIDIDERRRADRDRAAFLSMISHEMRNPLGVMSVHLQLARMGGAPEPALWKKLESQIDRLARLVGDLSDIAGIEEGRPLAISRQPLDLGEVVRRTVESLQASLAARTDACTIALQSGGEPLPLWGDARRIEQVLVNLIENAIKFSPPEGVVRVRLSTDGGEHRLSVSDSGIGIAPDDLPRITRKYFRARNASASPGLGLGLAIAREIVERHGGELLFESALGVGTTATVVLPITGP